MSLLAATLESLTDQLSGRTITVSNACLKLERQLETILTVDREAALVDFLPLILDRMFHDRSWLGFVRSMTDVESLHSLLQPEGLLFSSALTSHYVASSQQLLQARFQIDDDERVDGAHYFLWYLASVPFTARQWTAQTSEAYAKLARAYLAFFLPSPLSPSRTILNSKCLCSARGVSHSSLALAAALSTFFIRVVTKRWLPVQPSLFLSMEAPWRAIHSLSVQVVANFVACNPSRFLLQVEQPSVSDVLLAESATILAEKAFSEHFRVAWVRCLHRVLLSIGVNGLGDVGVFALIVDTWSAVCAPWSIVKRGTALLEELLPASEEAPLFASFWTPYIANQACAYEVLGALLLLPLSRSITRFAAPSEQALDLGELLEATAGGVGKLTQLMGILVDALGPILPAHALLRAKDDLREQLQVLQLEDAAVTLLSDDFRDNCIVPLVQALNRLDACIRRAEQAPAGPAPSPWKRLAEWASSSGGAASSSTKYRSLASLTRQSRHDLGVVFRVSDAAVSSEAAARSPEVEAKTPQRLRKRLPGPAALPAAAAIIHTSSSDLPRSYEIPELLPLTRDLSSYLTHKWSATIACLRAQHPFIASAVPASVASWRVNVRWMAARPNLAFLCLLAFAWHLLTRE